MKAFNCVRMKHDFQGRIERETVGMTMDQFMEYMSRGAAEFRRRHGPCATRPEATGDFKALFDVLGLDDRRRDKER